jgi:peptide/nickel transport system ATP-binding protein
MSGAAPARATETGEPALRVRGLSTWFHAADRRILAPAKAVDGVDLELEAGRTLALVGESGSGKTLTALSILRLVPFPGEIVAGEIRFEGRDLLRLTEQAMREVRGRGIALVPQEPSTALDPLFTIGEQIAEGLRRHLRLPRAAARSAALESLSRVHVPDPERCARSYPHELSGGLRQRALLAIAISLAPRVILADEPTSSLDATLAAQILDLLAELQRREGQAVLLVTHDLALVAERADRVAVMYAGKIVERASVAELFRAPRHPYTIALLRALPARTPPGQRLASIPGAIPDAWHFPSGCRFRTRCPLATEKCKTWEPLLMPVSAAGSDPRGEHLAACHYPEEAARL